MPKILITDALNCPLPPLPMGVVRFPARGPVTEGLDAEALVVWNTPKPALHQLIHAMPNLKWVQGVMAGVDHVISAPLPPHVLLTNGKGLHDAPTAELAVTLLLNGVRRMHRWRDLQQQNTWDKTAYHLGLNFNNAAGLGTLEDARVLILGMGSIGTAIGRRLQAFGAKVEGIANQAGVREGFVTHAVSDMKALLPKADALISILPETEATRGIITYALLAQLPKHAWFVNAGRGSAVDEAGLIRALTEKRIAGAAVDVTATEPLPPESPLWNIENLIITPHVAGGGPRFYAKACALLQRNVERFVRGETLENVIDPARGY